MRTVNETVASVLRHDLAGLTVPQGVIHPEREPKATCANSTTWRRGSTFKGSGSTDSLGNGSADIALTVPTTSPTGRMMIS